MRKIKGKLQTKTSKQKQKLKRQQFESNQRGSKCMYRKQIQAIKQRLEERNALQTNKKTAGKKRQ